jgi:hypothetical protein
MVQALNPKPVDRSYLAQEWAICRIVDGFVFEAVGQPERDILPPALHGPARRQY